MASSKVSKFHPPTYYYPTLTYPTRTGDTSFPPNVRQPTATLGHFATTLALRLPQCCQPFSSHQPSEEYDLVYGCQCRCSHCGGFRRTRARVRRLDKHISPQHGVKESTRVCFSGHLFRHGRSFSTDLNRHYQWTYNGSQPRSPVD